MPIRRNNKTRRPGLGGLARGALTAVVSASVIFGGPQAQGRTHHGILLICQDNIKGKDMGPVDVVRAIDNLLASGLPVAHELHILNHWR